MPEQTPLILTGRKTEDFKVDASVIRKELDLIEKRLDATQTNSDNSFVQIAAALNHLKSESDQIKANQPKILEQRDKFKFYLEKDENFFADESLEKIISEGQKMQAEYWHSAEERLSKRFSSPYGAGWLGSAVSPLIRIMCYEPEYHFHNTIRLGGRMKLDGFGWNSVLYTELDGDNVLIDNNGWGMQTNAPVGIYVEPSTVVNGVTIRAFEQQICNIIIAALNGALPVYMAMNQDRFLMQNVNIQQHQGALVGVKHGPVLEAPWYKTVQVLEGHVALPDPRFINLQMEGPFSSERKQAAMMLSGTNGIISNLNLHGWKNGVLVFSDHNWLINGITAHNGKKANGVQFAPDNEILLYCISQVESIKRSAVSCANPCFKGWYLPKWSKAPETAGFYNKGEMII